MRLVATRETLNHQSIFKNEAHSRSGNYKRSEKLGDILLSSSQLSHLPSRAGGG
jgi:hypothetical protein